VHTTSCGALTELEVLFCVEHPVTSDLIRR